MRIETKFRTIIVPVTILLALTLTLRSQSADTLRLLSYNLDDLRSTSLSRIADLRSVMLFMKPQLIVAQGINDSLAYSNSFDLLGDESRQAMTPFLGPNRSVLIYDSTHVTVLDYNAVPTAYFTIDEYILVAPASMDTFIIASCQFVEGSDSIAIAGRALQSQALRTHLHQRQSQYIVVAGTLNYLSSMESGFRWLTDDAPFGDSLLRNPMRDPIDTFGIWHHNSEFGKWHTYSSRVDTSQDTSGLVDRFDYVLLSLALHSYAYRPATYRVVGNFGNSFRQSVTRNGNFSNPFSESLMAGSRHLPVQVELIFRKSTTGVERTDDILKTMDLSENHDGMHQVDGDPRSFGIPPLPVTQSTPQP